MTTKNCVYDADGNLINVGDWDYQIKPVQVGEQEVIISPERTDEDGNVIPAVTEMQPVYEDQATNPLPEGATVVEKEVVYDADHGWIINDLETAKARKIAELNAACNAAILAGFSSDASGATCQYSFDYEAQINMAGTKQFFKDNPTLTVDWGTEDSGVVTLDATMFDTLWMDGFVHKNSNIQRYRTLKEQVNAATTNADVEAIVWS